MSNYPPGYSGGVEWDGLVEHKCPNCNYTWFAPMIEELGGLFYRDENDACCEKCDAEGVMTGETQDYPEPDYDPPMTQED